MDRRAFLKPITRGECKQLLARAKGVDPLFHLGTASPERQCPGGRFSRPAVYSVPWPYGRLRTSHKFVSGYARTGMTLP